MKKTEWIIAMAAAAICCLPFYVAASDQKTTTEVTRLDQVVVTATKYETTIRDVPASVTVISASQLANQNFPNQDIGDALRAVPGITLRRAYAPFPAYANIRGAGSDATIYLVNGIPTDWQISQAIPLEIVEKVEIIRGPASALYGANAGGGVVNLILKEGKEDPSGALKGGAGTFGRYRTAASADGKVENFSYALAGYYEEADGTNIAKNNVNAGVHMIDDCDYDKRGAAVSTGCRFSDQASARLFYNFYNNRYTRGRPYVGGDWDYHFAGVIYNQKIGQALDLKASAAYRVDDYLHLYDKGGTNYAKNQKRFMDYDEAPMEVQATAALGPHTLTTGVFYNNQTTDQEYRDWVTGNFKYENNFKVRTLAGYAQDVWDITESLVLTGGVRYDHWKNYDNQFSNFITPNPDDRTDDNVSPKLGLRYNFENAASLWTNYSMGFKPPTSEQLYDDRTSGGNPRQPNPDLKPEKTHSWEIGATRWFGDLLQTDMVGFYGFTDDKIMSWFDASNVWINKNIGQSRSYGVELAAAFYPTSNLSLTASYTFNRATIEDNPSNTALEGNYLPFSPKHKANLGVTYTRPECFTLSTYLRYLGMQYSDDANTVKNAGGTMLMKESLVVDIKGTKHFRVNWGVLKKIDLSLSVDNLFDEDYRTFYMYEDPGTTVFFEAEIGY
jgi:outer membrane receptor protein involved in Fe transport